MTTNQEQTEQLNLRMPSRLIKDIELISKTLRVNKSEWIKIKLGEMIYQEKIKLQERYFELSKKGIITKKELEEIFE